MVSLELNGASRDFEIAVIEDGLEFIESPLWELSLLDEGFCCLEEEIAHGEDPFVIDEIAVEVSFLRSKIMHPEGLSHAPWVCEEEVRAIFQ